MDLLRGRGLRGLGAGQVAAILGLPAQIGQRRGKSRHATGFGAHGTAPPALAAIRARADQDAGIATYADTSADTAAVTITSTSRSEPASRASPQARAGA